MEHRHRALDYQHFIFDYRLTGIGDNIAGNYVKSTSKLPFLKCTPITVTQDVQHFEYNYHYFLLGNPSMGLFTWQEVYRHFIVYSRPVTAEWVGHSVSTADR